jgi:hypothetical protein
VGTAQDLHDWLRRAGIADIEIEPQTGFVLFGGRKAA